MDGRWPGTVSGLYRSERATGQGWACVYLGPLIGVGVNVPPLELGKISTGQVTEIVLWHFFEMREMHVLMLLRGFTLNV